MMRPSVRPSPCLIESQCFLNDVSVSVTNRVKVIEINVLNSNKLSFYRLAKHGVTRRRRHSVYKPTEVRINREPGCRANISADL